MTNPTPVPLQVSIEEAAILLRCSPRQVKYMLQRGDLRKVYVGRMIRIPMRELERWQQEQLDEQAQK